jgi:hypothetical protein
MLWLVNQGSEKAINDQIIISVSYHLLQNIPLHTPKSGLLQNRTLPNSVLLKSGSSVILPNSLLPKSTYYSILPNSFLPKSILPKSRFAAMYSIRVLSTKVQFYQSPLCSKMTLYQIIFYQSPVLPKSCSTKVPFYWSPFYQSPFYQSPNLLKCILPKSGLRKKCDSTKLLSTKDRPPCSSLSAWLIVRGGGDFGRKEFGRITLFTQNER